MANDCDAVLIGICCCHGVAFRGNPVVGAVGEMASMKRRKFGRRGEDGLCCSSSAIQTQPGPSSLLEEQSKTPIIFVFSLCCRLPPKLGKRPRYIDRVYVCFSLLLYCCISFSIPLHVFHLLFI